MPDRLLLRFDSDGDSTWLTQAADGRMLHGSTRGFPPSTVVAGAAEIIVLTPAEDVLLTEARVAARNRAQLMQAVPFAIEDQLLTPVEDLHFAATRGPGDTVGVAVVAKATLHAWLDRLDAAGIRPDALLPESIALPSPADRAAALIENDRAIVRFAQWSAFVCAPADLAAWLQRANGAGPPRPLDAYDFRDGTATPLPGAITNLQERQRDPLAFLARNLGKPPLNFLEGQFAPQHRAAHGARLWRIAAVLAAIVLVLAVANLGFEVVQLARASARMDTLAEDAVRKAFPEIDAAELARYPPAELARNRIERLRGGAQGNGFLHVVAEIAPVIGSTTRIQTRGIEFRNGALELGLRAPDVATLDAVRERLAALPGLKVAVTAANPSDNGIDGRIRIGSENAGGAP
ncbi:MAG TPA: type II secretion system protein GspL [Rhodanobacteraceae bacterium]|jgi:general secretion pathway protein L|nr:type II secretion system protein GspL [Rhodanobacteraceae bacterium]